MNFLRLAAAVVGLDGSDFRPLQSVHKGVKETGGFQRSIRARGMCPVYALK